MDHTAITYRAQPATFQNLYARPKCNGRGESDLDDPMWALANLSPYKKRGLSVKTDISGSTPLTLSKND